MVYGTHKAQWHQGEVIVQTENEEKAKRLIHYATCLYENQDPELKALNPLAGKPSQLSIEWASGGRVFGIPAGENKIRMFHPTLYVQDESSFLPEAQQCYDAAAPVTQQIIAISSAGPGWFGDECQAPAATAQDQAEIMAEIENTVANKYPYPIDRKDFDQLSETQRAEWMRNGAPRKR
jgi:hypothetical protein